MRNRTNTTEAQKAYIAFAKKYIEIIEDTIKRIDEELLGVDDYEYMDAINKGYILRHSYKLLRRCQDLARIMVHIKYGSWQWWSGYLKLEPNEIYILACIVEGQSLEDIADEFPTSAQVISNYINRVGYKFVSGIIENNFIEAFNTTYKDNAIYLNKNDMYVIKDFKKWIITEIKDNIKINQECGLLLLPKID